MADATVLDSASGGTVCCADVPSSTLDHAVSALAKRLAAGTRDADGAAYRTAHAIVAALAQGPCWPVTMLVVTADVEDVRLVACRIDEWLREVEWSSPRREGGPRRYQPRVAWMPDLGQRPLRWALGASARAVRMQPEIQVIGAVRGSAGIQDRLLKEERWEARACAEQERSAVAQVQQMHLLHPRALALLGGIDATWIAWTRNHQVLLGAGQLYEAIARDSVVHVIRSFRDVRTGEAPVRLDRRHRHAVRACFAGDRDLYRAWLVDQMVGDGVISQGVAAGWLADEM